MTGPSGEESADQVLARCRKKAMDLLAQRPHFRAELAFKLSRRDFPASAVGDTCAWLEERSYLDDGTAARQLVAGALRRKGFGPRRMRAELVRRGVDDAIIDETLAAAWAGGEDERALEVARRRAGRRGFDRDRIGRHLAGKGYGAAAIYRALDDLEKERRDG